MYTDTNILDNFKVPGTHQDTACLTDILWKPSFFRIVTTLPLNGAHQLEIKMTLTAEAGQSLTNQVYIYVSH